MDFFVKKYIFIIILLLFLTPAVNILDLTAVRIDDILLITFPILIVALRGRIRLDARLYLLMLIGVSYIFGIIFGFAQGYPAAISDFSFIIMLLKYAGVIILMSSIRGDRGELIKYIIKCSLIAGFILFLIAIMQFFDIGGLNSLYVSKIAPTQFETLVDDYPWPRPVGMIGNPNELGMLFVTVAILGVLLKIIDKNVTKFWLALVPVMWIAAAMTTSRTALFGGVIACLFLLFNIVFSKKINLLIFRKALGRRFLYSAFLFLGIFITVIILAQIDHVNNLIFWRFLPENYDSFEARYVAWEANFSAWIMSPIFGVGPLKRAGIFFDADNEHLLLLRIGGVLLWAEVMLLMFVGYFSIYKNYLYNLLSSTLSVLMVSFMVPSAVFHNVVIFPYVLMIWCAVTPVGGRIKNVV